MSCRPAGNSWQHPQPVGTTDGPPWSGRASPGDGGGAQRTGPIPSSRMASEDCRRPAAREELRRRLGQVRRLQRSRLMTECGFLSAKGSGACITAVQSCRQRAPREPNVPDRGMGLAGPDCLGRPATPSGTGACPPSARIQNVWRRQRSRRGSSFIAVGQSEGLHLQRGPGAPTATMPAARSTPFVSGTGRATNLGPRCYPIHDVIERGLQMTSRRRAGKRRFPSMRTRDRRRGLVRVTGRAGHRYVQLLFRCCNGVLQ